MPRSLSPSPVGPAALPAQPFFASPSQRVRLARERFFDAGQRPTGLVPEAVIQSWTRCLSARRSPGEAVAFDPISRARARNVMARSRGLLQAASGEIERLESTLAGTGCRVLLTDGEGVIVHATPQPGVRGGMLPVVGRIGVPLGELASGSNAPGIVVHTGRPCTVLGAEHFFERIAPLHCAAAPIRDSGGGLVGVLDLTIEARPFAFDASALVALYAAAIENSLLQTAGAGQLVLQFQVTPALLDTPLEALAGITGDGRLAWCNSTAQQLLGIEPTRAQGGCVEPQGATHDAETLFGASMAALLSRVAHAGPVRFRLGSGLRVWLRARASGTDGGPGRLWDAGRRACDTTVSLVRLDTRSRSGPEAVAAARTDCQVAHASTDAQAGVAGGVEPAPHAARPAHAVVCAEAGDAAAGAAAPATGDHRTGGCTRGANGGTTVAACAQPRTPEAPMPAPAHQADLDALTLEARTHALIEQTLAACDGNLARAARQLGVSRGLLYRRRRAAMLSSSAAAGPAEGAALATAPKRIPGAPA